MGSKPFIFMPFPIYSPLKPYIAGDGFRLPLLHVLHAIVVLDRVGTRKKGCISASLQK